MQDQTNLEDTVDQVEARLQHLRRVTEEIANQHDEVAEELGRRLAPERIERLRQHLGMIGVAEA